MLFIKDNEKGTSSIKNYSNNITHLTKLLLSVLFVLFIVSFSTTKAASSYPCSRCGTIMVRVSASYVNANVHQLVLRCPRSSCPQNTSTVTRQEAHSINSSTGVCSICNRAVRVLSSPKTSYTYTGNTINFMGNQTGGFTCSGTMMALNVGTYTATITPLSGYTWASGTQESRTFTWRIIPKSITISAKSQMIQVNETIDTSVNAAEVTGLCGSDTLSEITISSSIGTSTPNQGTITPSNAIIMNGLLNKTSNYSITYKTAPIVVHDLGFDVDLHMVPEATVDITNATKQSLLIVHNCNDYAFDSFNDTYHYRVCKLCLASFEEDLSRGDIDANTVWETPQSEIITDASGELMIVVTGSYGAHNYTSNSWSMGSKNLCQNANHHYFYCDCGYAHIDDTGKASHSWGSEQSGAIFRYWHRRVCSKCSARDAGERCYYGKNNTLISCKNVSHTNTKTCKGCSRTYDVKSHRSADGGNCKYCDGGPYDDYSTATLSITSAGTRKSNITFQIKLVNNKNSFSNIQAYLSQALNVDKVAETPLEKKSYSNKIVTMGGVFQFRSDVAVYEKLYPTIQFYQWLDTDGYTRVHLAYHSTRLNAVLRREYTSPVISSLNVESNDSYFGWSTKNTIHISGTENYCKSVGISVKDLETGKLVPLGEEADDTKVYTTVDDSKNWEFNIVASLGADNDGHTYQVIVFDTLGNETTQDFEILKVDCQPPTIKVNAYSELIITNDSNSSSQLDDTIIDDDEGENDEEDENANNQTKTYGYITTSEEWSPSKSVVVSATDVGVEVAELKLQNVGSFVDSYGVNDITVEDGQKICSRTYVFVGNVKGSKTLSSTAKDPLGNSSGAYIKVFNLDNTAPTITNAVGDENRITANISDNLSGVNGYIIQEGDTRETAPGLSASWTALNPASTEQDVHTTNPENSSKVYALTVNSLNPGTYTLWVKDQAGNMKSNDDLLLVTGSEQPEDTPEYDEPVPAVTVDITDAVLDSSISSHTCSAYAVDSYNEEKHWKECSLCSTLYYQAGRPKPTGSEWNINQSSLVEVSTGVWALVINNTIEDHSYTDFWDRNPSEVSSCHESNLHHFTCSCGRSYTSTDGRKQHGTVNGFGYNYNDQYHYVHCYDCNSDGARGLHTYNGGTPIPHPAQSLTYCETCGAAIKPRCHEAGVAYDYVSKVFRSAETDNGQCVFGDVNIIDLNYAWVNVNYDNKDENGYFTINAQFKANFRREDFSTVTYGTSTQFYETYAGSAQYVSGPYVPPGTNDIAYAIKAKFNEGIAAKSYTLVIDVAEFTMNNGDIYRVHFYLDLPPENQAPTATVNVAADSAVEGWITNNTITVSGQENYCQSVSLQMVETDTNEEIVSVPVIMVDPITHTYSYTFSPDISFSENSRSYTFRIKDQIGNEREITQVINKTDSTAPEFVSSSNMVKNSNILETQSKAWTQSKNASISAKDNGINVAKIKIQNVLHGLNQSETFTDSYGFTTMNTATTPYIWSRDYIFTGDVTGFKTLKANTKDDVQNQDAIYFRVYNLDNTLPQISNLISADVNNNTFTCELSDSGSGIKYFGIIPKTSSTFTDSMYPTTKNTTVVNGGNKALEFNKWFLTNLETTNATGGAPESGKESLEVTFKTSSTDEYYVLAEDYVGNRTYRVIRSVASDNEPPIGTIRVKNAIPLSDGREGVNTRNVTLQIHAEDNGAIESILLRNEDHKEDPIEASEWIPWGGNATGDLELPWELSQGEGTKVVYLQIKDANGNVSTSISTVEWHVEYEPNAGTDTVTNMPTTQIKNKDEDLSISPLTPVRSGYNFLGWGTTASATSSQYAPNATYSLNQDLTLYAIWQKILYLYLDPAGGSIPSTSGYSIYTNGYGLKSAKKTITGGATLGTLPTPTKTDYIFEGWYNKSPNSLTDFGKSGGVLTASTNNYRYEKVYDNVQPGLTYNVQVTATKSAGSASQFSVVIFDHTSNTRLANISMNFGTNQRGTITCPETADGTHQLSLLAYAGIVGSTANNTVTFGGFTVVSNGNYNDVNYTNTSTMPDRHLQLCARWRLKDGTFYYVRPSKGTFASPDTSSSTLTLQGSYTCDYCRRKTSWYYDTVFYVKCNVCNYEKKITVSNTRWWCSGCQRYINTDYEPDYLMTSITSGKHAHTN